MTRPAGVANEIGTSLINKAQKTNFNNTKTTKEHKLNTVWGNL